MRKTLILALLALFIITPFSQVLAVGTDYRYTGKPLDSSTNLYYYGQRYYDPSVGQFTQPDPVLRYLNDPQKLKKSTGQDLQQFLEDPQKLNDYSYTLDNPVKYIDPTGEQAQLVAPVVVPVVLVADTAIAAGVAAVVTVVVVTVAPIIIKAAEKVGEGIAAMSESITALFSRSDGELIEKIDSFNKPIQKHKDKLNNPNEPGGKDPRYRKDWKNHIDKAINNMKKVAEKIKNKEKRERELDRINKKSDEVNQIPVVVPQTGGEKNEN